MKYPALTFVSTVQLIVGWIAVAIGVVVVIWGMANTGNSAQNWGDAAVGFGRIFGGVGICAYGFLSVLAGEWSKVFTDIEANTARSTLALQAVLQKLIPDASIVAPAHSEAGATNAGTAAILTEPGKPATKITAVEAIETVESRLAVVENCAHEWRTDLVDGRFFHSCTACGAVRGLT